MTTLIERYVQEVVRRVPADQRDDIAAELKGTIADTVDARQSTVSSDAAEREVLTEMGDPARLAARYTDRPSVLIGPGLYPAYTRLLAMLLTVVLPVVVVVGAAVEVLDGGDAGAAIGGAVTTIISVGGQMVAWLTLVFAAVERWAPGTKLGTWTPDQLPPMRAPDDKRSDAVAHIAWHNPSHRFARVAIHGRIGLHRQRRAHRPPRPGPVERMDVADPRRPWWPRCRRRPAVGRPPVDHRLVAAAVVAELVFAAPLAWILYQQQFFNRSSSPTSPFTTISTPSPPSAWSRSPPTRSSRDCEHCGRDLDGPASHEPTVRYENTTVTTCNRRGHC